MIKRLSKGDFLAAILRSPRTVFSTKDVALMWSEGQAAKVTGRLNKYVSAGKLIRVRRGLYAKDAQYDRFELATRIYTPAYISFETVLTRAGINFQHYKTIFVASYVTREIKIGGQKFSFRRIRGDILSNILGIDHQDGIAMATKERAFLDRLFISKDYHFDNLRALDWKKVFTMLPIYHSKRLEKKVGEYYEH